jgi:hypothetical protein
MNIKNIILIFTLFFILGCGVMNNPEDNSKKAEIDNAPVMADTSWEVVKIKSEALIISNDNSDFVNNHATYRVFETFDAASLFLTDLNSSAQTLSDEDYKLVKSWIKNIKDQNIDYVNKNLLFYPIQTNDECGIRDNIIIQGTNAAIELQTTKLQCESIQMYYALFFSISKEIENVKFKIFDKEEVTVLNSAN